ncbi:hypothetical protein KGF56_004528 [Candida oxycetoniae]|uniref:Uncharacterized protein n=1 Tax=Candida oxycetoniae TaxID=497107 RepID=A0AAI9WW45_9ASCO|nr:uncharacterized protein KGF56_004528 [Candida oxycetoniae]KAI3402647.1 hypothetical protein KGF56_004528 [Candida oxycetoniae]
MRYNIGNFNKVQVEFEDGNFSGSFRPVLYRNVRSFSQTSSVQFFNKSPSAEEQQQTFAKVKKVLEEHPQLRQLTLEFKTLLEAKGLLVTGKPSMSQMMKLLTDKDIIAHGKKLKDYLESEDTGLTKDELATITGAYMFQGKDLQ